LKLYQQNQGNSVQIQSKVIGIILCSEEEKVTKHNLLDIF
jgi:hypothetical protein